MSEAVLNGLAAQFVQLTLCKSLYDTGDVQWYVEGPFWRRTNMCFSREYKTLPDYEIGDRKHGRTLENIRDETDALKKSLMAYHVDEERERQRVEYLIEHVNSLLVRCQMMLGKNFSFNEMTEGLYNLVAPAFDYKQFDQMLLKMEVGMPGTGPILSRIDTFRKQIAIPKDRLLKVLTLVTEEFHRASMKQMRLTGNSMPRIRVRKLPKPNTVFISTLFGYDYDHIQYERNFNIDFPWDVEKVMEYVGHEMEPGHLTYYEKRTQTFIDTSWPEMSIVSLYSPSSAFTEGSARYASDLCFECSMEKKVKFEKEYIFKTAGLDENLVCYMPLWHEFTKMSGYGKLEASRNIWDNIWTKEEGLDFLKRYGFLEQAAGIGDLEEILDDVGHYVCHDYARDVVTYFFEGTVDTSEEKWKLYENLCFAHMSMRQMKEQSYRPEQQPWRL